MLQRGAALFPAAALHNDVCLCTYAAGGSSHACFKIDNCCWQQPWLQSVCEVTFMRAAGDLFVPAGAALVSRPGDAPTHQLLRAALRWGCLQAGKQQLVTCLRLQVLR